MTEFLMNYSNQRIDFMEAIFLSYKINFQIEKIIEFIVYFMFISILFYNVI